MTLNNKQNLKDQIPNLEGRFDALRVYGDERDFDIFEVKESKSEKNCEVPIRADFLYPELKDDPQNKRLLSIECVENALIEFVKYKYRNWSKTVSYNRIEDKHTEDFDLSNSCAIKLSSYVEIINARRTDPEKTKAISKRLIDNIELINQYKYGKITKREFEGEMRRRTADLKEEQSRPRSMELLKKDNEVLIQHIEKYVGKIEKSIHNQAFELAPLSIHVIPETRDRKGGALATTGLSVLPMHPPNPMRALRYSELLIRLLKIGPYRLNVKNVKTNSQKFKQFFYKWKQAE